jgi:hypothetical protein
VSIRQFAHRTYGWGPGEAGPKNYPCDGYVPTNLWSVVTLTSSESAAGKLLSPQAEASDLMPALNGMRSGTVSMPVMNGG